MTDDLDAALAGLEATQKRSHRIFRRTVLISAGLLLALAVLNVVLVLLSPIHDPWLFRNLIAIGGLTVLGMLGHLGATRAYQTVVDRDALLLDETRKRVELSRVLDEVRDQMRPLVDAMHEAHAKGVALVIQPFDIEPLKPPVLN